MAALGPLMASRNIMVTATTIIFTMENSRLLRIFLSSPTDFLIYFLFL